MMTVRKFVIVNDESRQTIGDFVPVAIFVNRRFVYIREIFFDNLVYGIGSAKYTDDIVFCERVCLLFTLFVDFFLFVWRKWQGYIILPIWMFSQKSIGVYPRFVILFADIFAVKRAGRPVHQLVYLERTRVYHIHTYF